MVGRNVGTQGWNIKNVAPLAVRCCNMKLPVLIVELLKELEVGDFDETYSDYH